MEAKLRQELIVKESEAWVAASVVAATAAALPAAPAAPARAQARKPMANEDDITGEVPPKVMSITLRFAGLLQEKIVKIFQNKFKPINLYRLRHMRGLRFDALQDNNRIGIEDGMFRL